VASEYTYTFAVVEACNMCAAPAESAKVLGRRLNASQGLRPTRRRGIATTVLRCRECGLVFSSPRPVPATVSQHYDVSPDEYWHDSYFADDAGYFSGQIDTFFHLAQHNGTPTALDVGAGLGKGMRSLTQRGFDTYGLEPSRPFFEAAIERGSISQDRLVCSTVEDAEYAPASFDFITFGAVLEHLNDPAASIERVLEWARPAALIHIEVPSAAWLVNRLVNAVYRVQGLDYCANISPMHVPYHLYEFTLESFQRHGSRAGYELAHSHRYVGDTYLPRALGKVAARAMAATGTGMQLEVWLRRRP
jgi:hypothetical protein